MQIEIKEKESFKVIGVAGRGSSKNGPEWIKPLWSMANDGFETISHFAKKDLYGNVLQVWGLMSDINMEFYPWGEEGLYMAGVEANELAVPVGNYAVWTVPAFKYITVKCTQETYSETFNHILSEYIMKGNYHMAGAVLECYDPQATDGSLYLYFPIERI